MLACIRNMKSSKWTNLYVVNLLSSIPSMIGKLYGFNFLLNLDCILKLGHFLVSGVNTIFWNELESCISPSQGFQPRCPIYNVHLTPWLLDNLNHIGLIQETPSSRQAMGLIHNACWTWSGSMKAIKVPFQVLQNSSFSYHFTLPSKLNLLLFFQDYRANLSPR